ncbi:hypothetical protein PLICRDRAFT_563012 [Plicaturopsis crispa FD-325 SS-3]|nr:hypothetical protein PLICRDRAFT_563012 [Plicaturopsis crispa FD-325 SS-3]
MDQYLYSQPDRDFSVGACEYTCARPRIDNFVAFPATSVGWQPSNLPPLPLQTLPEETSVLPVDPCSHSTWQPDPSSLFPPSSISPSSDQTFASDLVCDNDVYKACNDAMVIGMFTRTFSCLLMQYQQYQTRGVMSDAIMRICFRTRLCFRNRCPLRPPGTRG